jgi:hypothetical protein
MSEMISIIMRGGGTRERVFSGAVGPYLLVHTITKWDYQLMGEGKWIDLN